MYFLLHSILLSVMTQYCHKILLTRGGKGICFFTKHSCRVTENVGIISFLFFSSILFTIQNLEFCQGTNIKDHRLHHLGYIWQTGQWVHSLLNGGVWLESPWVMFVWVSKSLGLNLHFRLFGQVESLQTRGPLKCPTLPVLLSPCYWEKSTKTVFAGGKAGSKLYVGGCGEIPGVWGTKTRDYSEE